MTEAHSVTDQFDPRYPIGRFTPSLTISLDDRAAYIETLRALPEQITAGVRGLEDAQLDTPYREGGWTVRQVVHHVADSHANCYIRFKLALTEDAPTIKPYDEAAWARLPDSDMPVDVSLALIASLHLRWVVLIQSMPDADFARTFYHPELGPQSLSTALALYAWHSRHHTAHITTLRARMGW